MTGGAYRLNGAERVKAVERLRVEYDRLVEVWGGIAPALVAIASMLDLMSVQTREGVRPDVVGLLLEAAERLKSPPAAITESSAPDLSEPPRLALLRRYVEHLRDILEGVAAQTPYPARSWTYDEFRALRAPPEGAAITTMPDKEAP